MFSVRTRVARLPTTRVRFLCTPTSIPLVTRRIVDPFRLGSDGQFDIYGANAESMDPYWPTTVANLRKGCAARMSTYFFPRQLAGATRAHYGASGILEG